MRRAGMGTKTRQFNPSDGAKTLAQWVTAVMSMKGESDAMPVGEAVDIIRATPHSRRSTFAREIWRKRKRSGNPGELLIFGNPSKLDRQRAARDRAARIRGARGNPDLFDSIGPRDKVTFLNRLNQSQTGRVVMRSSHGGWVLNMGGRYGTPAVIDRSTPITKVRKTNDGNDVFKKHQIAIAKATLRMSDAGARIIGGMTKDEAKAILLKYGFGNRKNPTCNPKAFAGWKHFTTKEKNFLRSIHMPAPKNEDEVRVYKETLRKIDEINARGKNPTHMQVTFDRGIQKYLAFLYDPKFGNLYATGFTKKQAAKALHDEVRRVRRTGSWRNPGEYACHRCGKDFTAAQVEAGERTRHIAEHRAEDAKRSTPGRRRKDRKRRNPDETRQAVKLFQSFHGRDPEEIAEKHVSAEMRKDYAAVGALEYLKVVTPLGQTAQFNFDGDGVTLASSPEGKQLYCIGGNQNLSQCLTADSLAKDFIDLGECIEVQYLARKVHGNFEPVSYFHKFGEKTGERPQLAYDKLKKQIFFVGGAYFINAKHGVSPGIEN